MDEQSDFAQGSAAILAAEQSFFGLFPHYDQEEVDRAILYYSRAYYLYAEEITRAKSAFYLTKAYLMRDDKHMARTWLQRHDAFNFPLYDEEADTLRKQLEHP